MNCFEKGRRIRVNAPGVLLFKGRVLANGISIRAAGSELSSYIFRDAIGEMCLRLENAEFICKQISLPRSVSQRVRKQWA